MKRIVLIGSWLALAAIGIWGLWMRLTTGHQLATYGSYVPWGLWVAGYIYFAGLSAGAFAVAILAVVFRQERLRPLLPLSLLTALAALAAALLVVWLDLGHLWRVFNLFLRPSFSSMMAWVVWMYAAYGVILVLALFFSLRGEERRTNQLVWTGAPIALFFPGASGALFGTVLAQGMWNSPIYPVLFLAGGILSGVALMTALSAFVGDARQGWADVTRRLGRVTLGLLAFYTLLEWAEYSIPLWYGVGPEFGAVMVILTGPYWYVYWIAHLLLGVIVPAALLIRLPDRTGWVGLAGLLTAASFLAVRLNLVIPSQVHPQLAGLVNAYRDARLSFEYLPSFFEWSILALGLAVAAALVAAGAWAFPAIVLRSGGKEPPRPAPGVGIRHPAPAKDVI